MPPIKHTPSPHQFDGRYDPYHFAMPDRRRADWLAVVLVALLVVFFAWFMRRPWPVDEHLDASHTYPPGYSVTEIAGSPA